MEPTRPDLLMPGPIFPPPRFPDSWTFVLPPASTVMTAPRQLTSAASPPDGDSGEKPVYVDLSCAQNPPLEGDRGAGWHVAWYVVSALLFESAVHLPYRWKAAILRLFGARIGHGVVIKPRVKIKYPWLLSIGNHTWLGEGVWIDNLALVTIGSHVCVSQGVFLCTGNHDWSDFRFKRIASPIEVDDQAWICARAILCPGAAVGHGTVLAAGAVLSGVAEVGMIYRGNPSTKVGARPTGPDSSFHTRRDSTLQTILPSNTPAESQP